MNIIDIITKEANVSNFHSYRFNLDNNISSPFEYDDVKITWRARGEDTNYDGPIDLSDKITQIQGLKPLFTYFLDGSRKTYKVDDISFNNKVYPVIAGQVSVVYCKRVNKEIAGGGPLLVQY